eukprot:885525_1
MVFSADARCLLTTCMDGGVRVFDLHSGRFIDHARFERPQTSIAFSPTGEFLVTSHVDSVRLFLWWAHTKMLDLSNCFGLGSSILERIVKHCAELHTLNLQCCSGIRDFTPIAKCTGLRRLSVAGCAVGGSAEMFAILKGCSRLHTLNAARSFKPANGLRTLKNAVPVEGECRLRSLSLSVIDSTFSPEDAHMLGADLFRDLLALDVGTGFEFALVSDNLIRPIRAVAERCRRLVAFGIGGRGMRHALRTRPILRDEIIRTIAGVRPNLTYISEFGLHALRILDFSGACSLSQHAHSALRLGCPHLTTVKLYRSSGITHTPAMFPSGGDDHDDHRGNDWGGYFHAPDFGMVQGNAAVAQHQIALDEQLGQIDLELVDNVLHPATGDLTSYYDNQLASTQRSDDMLQIMLDSESPSQMGESTLQSSGSTSQRMVRVRNLRMGKHELQSSGNMSQSSGHVSPSSGHVSQSSGHVSQSSGHVSQSSGHVSQSSGHVSQSSGHVSQSSGHVSQ